MKILASIFLLFLINCGTNKTLNTPVKLTAESCPENGNCTIEIIPNKTLNFEKDEFGNTYPAIKEGSKTLIIYEYSRIQKEKLPDGYYSEKVYAEVDAKFINKKLIDNDLQQVKLYYARLCYCKGASGYFPIKKGMFHLQQTGKDSLQLQINYALKQVPQLTSKINETISLK